jgi:hypothetical protein
MHKSRENNGHVLNNNNKKKKPIIDSLSSIKILIIDVAGNGIFICLIDRDPVPMILTLCATVSRVSSWPSAMEIEEKRRDHILRLMKWGAVPACVYICSSELISSIQQFHSSRRGNIRECNLHKQPEMQMLGEAHFDPGESQRRYYSFCRIPKFTSTFVKLKGLIT